MIVLIGGVVLWNRYEQSQAEARAEARRAALAAVCDSGSPIDGAAVYSEAPGVHPVAIVDSPSMVGFSGVVTRFELAGSYRDAYPDEWVASELTQIELVACLDDAGRDLETCRYAPRGGGMAQGTIVRHQDGLRVRLLRARDASVVDEGLILGSVPDQCPKSLLGSAFKQIRGTPIGPKDVTAWLRRYVELQ